MEVMRGDMAIRAFAYYIHSPSQWPTKVIASLIGRIIIPTVPYSEGYFLEDAKEFRAAVSLPLVYVGGLVSRQKMEEVLDAGVDGLQVARALFHDTDVVNKLQSGEQERSGCGHSNYCIGRMYSLDARCHHCVPDLPACLQREIDKSEERWSH